jgi:hypothetical protein
MGFFSSIWSGITSVFTGIMTIFSPILKPLGAILNSGWGKALMLAMSVFTLGTSLMAGASAWGVAAGEGASFMGKFVAGGKAFLSSALGIKPKGGEQLAAGTGVDVGVQAGSGGAAAQLQAGGAVNPGDLLAANVPGGGEVARGSMAMGPGPTGDVMQQVTTAGGGGAAGSGAIPGLTPGAPGTPLSGATPPPTPSVLPGGIDPAGTSSKAMTKMAAKPTAAAPQGFGTVKETGNWLSKAANKAWEWANTDLGTEIIGGAMQGYYQGKRDDAYYAEQRRIDDMWRNPNDPGMIGIESSRQRTERYSPPRGLAGAPAIYANRLSQGAIENYAPSVPVIGGGGQ